MSEKEEKSVAPPSAPGIVDWGSWGLFPFKKAGSAASTAWNLLAHPAMMAGTLCLVLGIVCGGFVGCTGGRIITPTPTITLPATLAAPVGRAVEIDATTNGKNVSWEATAPDYDLVIAAAPSAKAAFVFPKPGQYVVTARTAIGSRIATATCAVTVGDAPPDPPGPGPNPPPVDPLAQIITTAWAQETDAAKVSQAQLLAALYEGSALSTVNDPSLKTLADLHAVMQKAGASLLPATALPKIRAVLATYIGEQLGTSPATPLDAAMRQKAAVAFKAVGDILGGLK